jgi:uncharacterized protein YegP (UPF0339 family)
MRWVVLPLAMMVAIGLAGWQHAAAQVKKATFEVYKDKGGDFRFRLKDDDGTLLAMSAKGYATKAALLKLVEVIRRDVAKARIEDADKGEKVVAGKGGVIFEMYKDKSGDYRFRLYDDEGVQLAIAVKGHRTKVVCHTVIDAIKHGAAKAKVVEEGR